MAHVGKVIGLFGGATAFGFLGALVGGNINVTWENSSDIGAVELLTVVLSALSLMLVILTIFLAVLGFIGISTINDRLKDHSRNYFNDELKEGKPAFGLLKEVVRDVIYRGIDPILDDESPYEEGNNNEPS